MINPLFPQDDDQTGQGFAATDKDNAPQPLTDADKQGSNANPAIDLIRQKLNRIYANEPDTNEELSEVGQPGIHRSKHQKFMYDLSVSGKSLADIQTEWHNYYVALPDEEKHQVWQEFYEANSKLSRPAGTTATGQAPAKSQTVRDSTDSTARISQPVSDAPTGYVMPADNRSIENIKQSILNRVSAGGKLRPKHHLQSLLFGLATGLVVLIIFLFGFFNEVVIAPFIQPSRTAAATPIIIDPNSVAPSSAPEIIIPKINLQIPVDYSQTTTDESQIETALENGIVHYPTTVKPGEKGNAAFFGHSSNNIFNKGKYKFAFVLLHELIPGDTFYLTKDSKVYVYKVISRDIVSPDKVSVLENIAGQTATATLITCDPPGTSLHRLVVVGQQVSPDPLSNASAATVAHNNQSAPQQLPGNGPTLWGRLWGWLF